MFLQAARILFADENIKRERFFIYVILLHPKSRGSVTLRSDDPFDRPVIDANFLSHNDDINTSIKGIRDTSL